MRKLKTAGVVLGIVFAVALGLRLTPLMDPIDIAIAGWGMAALAIAVTAAQTLRLRLTKATLAQVETDLVQAVDDRDEALRHAEEQGLLAAQKTSEYDQLVGVADNLDNTGKVLILAWRWAAAVEAEAQGQAAPIVAGVVMDEAYWRKMTQEAVKARWPEAAFSTEELTALLEKLGYAGDTDRWERLAHSQKGFELPRKWKKRTKAGATP